MISIKPVNAYYHQCECSNINNQAHHYRIRNCKIYKGCNQCKHNICNCYKIPFFYILFVIFNKFLSINFLIIIAKIELYKLIGTLSSFITNPSFEYISTLSHKSNKMLLSYGIAHRLYTL